MSNRLAYQVIPAGRATPADFAQIGQLAVSWGSDGTEQTRNAHTSLCLAAALNRPVAPAGCEPADKAPLNAALVICVSEADPKHILGILTIMPRASYLMDEAFSQLREAYLESCRSSNVRARHLDEPFFGLMLRPSAVQWSCRNALAGPSIPMIATDPQAGSEVVDTLIKGVRSYQESLEKGERLGYTLALHGDDVQRYYVSADRILPSVQR